MIRTSLLVAFAAVLLIPASAAADTVTFGSDLAGRPDVMDDSHLADTLFYNTSAKNSNRAPASGEILQILVKGAIIPHGNGRQDLNLWHSQVLRPQADGSVTVDSSSQDLFFPVGEPVDRIHRFVPSVQCVRAGDYIDFNHIGGWDGGPDGTGTKYQIFKSDQNSQMNWYEHDNGTNIGANFVPNRQVFGNTGRENTGNPQHGAPYPRELMMQVTIGTGFDSSSLCEGGAKGAEYSGAAITRKLFSVADDGVAGARIGCTTGRGFCEGTAKLSFDGTEIGVKSFKIDRNTTTNLPIQLTPAGARLVSEKGQIDADVIVDSRDELGQQRTTSGVSELKSLRPPGFYGLTVKPQSASVKNGAFSFKATCPMSTAMACAGKISISSQKRVVLRRGTRGKIYKIGAGKFLIGPGKTVRVPIKLGSGGRAVFKKFSKVVTIATTKTTDGSGNSASRRSKLTLKRR